MHKQIIWSPAAEEDFDEILSYLSSNWSNKVVNKFIDNLDDYLLLISRNPKLFPLINKELHVRKCVLTKQNILFYHVLKNRIEIIRIFDSRQNPEKLNF